MPDDTAYPIHLVPQPTYQRLACSWLTGALLLRRTPQPEVTDASGKIRPDQLSHPTEDLARHFSVNLLGDFQLQDLAWNIRRDVEKVRKEQLFAAWNPGEAGVVPDGEETERMPATSWGYCWLPLHEVHSQRFESIGETFTCYVCHAPTRCNYWHFELHFHNEQGDVYHLEAKQRKKVAPKIRAWLQDYVLTHPPEAVPKASKWPEDIYISAAPPTSVA